MAKNNKSQVDLIVERWRDLIATKKRKIISFEETLALKIEALKRWIYPDSEPLAGWEIRHFQYTNKCERVFVDEEYRPIRVGENWGGEEMSAFFRCKAKMPARFKGQKVVLRIYFSGDGLLSVNGRPYHGLDPFRDTVPMESSAQGDEEYDLTAESFIRWHFGEGNVKTFEISEFAVVDEEISAAYWDLLACYFVMMSEETDKGVRQFLTDALTRATQPLDQNATSHEAASLQAAQARSIIRKLVYDSEVFRTNGLLKLAGHSHLDCVYLWPYSEFLRKIGRTHSTSLRLMEEYDFYRFSQSQPLMYKEMKRLYPTMFEEVKNRVREGRWEVIGAFWVEPDCNLISGESFVRQIQFGTRFYEEEFGITPKTAWIPDVFGNAWTMPQIVAKCGLKYFVTHKMSMWNDTNKWTHSAFWWQGPDGTRVFATVPPTHFIGTMDPAHMQEHWNHFSEKETIGQSLYCYGWGDGGGGPDQLMLECGKRYKDFPGMPRAEFSTIEETLEEMYQQALTSKIPVINDELYLEEHRGVHTTKARLKKLNRHCELTFRKAELYSCFSTSPYPRKRLTEGWELLLNNQFHDSLPGTHINSVYGDILDDFNRILPICDGTLRDSLENIAARVDTRGEGDAILLFNSQAFTRDSVAQVPLEERPVKVLDPDGREIPCQFLQNYETGKTVLAFHALGLPPVGYAAYRLVEGTSTAPGAELKVAENLLENAFLKVEINPLGEIISLFDKTTGRETLDPSHRSNIFHVFEDEPGHYDAWDIVRFYENYPFEIEPDASIRIVETGPVRAAIEVTRTLLGSRIVQRIVLGAQSRRLDFETWVDWKETHKLLKVRFHTNIVSRKATFDLPYGNIERSTYANNSFEAARFEVPAHFWMDISQPDSGISILNDCKYGHQAKESMLCLTLLRSPKDPDPLSDIEEHFFTYSIYPHKGTWREGDTVCEAQDLNDKVDILLTSGHEGELPPVHSLLHVESRAVLLEALKKAESSEAMVLRFCDRHGVDSTIRVRLPRTTVKVNECNLIEREAQPVACDNGDLVIAMKPYEIRTLMVE